LLPIKASQGHFKSEPLHISDFIVAIKKEQSLANDLAQCLGAMPAILDKIAIESPSMKLKRAQALQKINYNPKKKVKQQIDNPQEETKEAQDEYSGKSDNSNDECNQKPSGKVYKETDTKIQNKSKQVKIRPSLSKAHDVQLSSQQYITNAQQREQNKKRNQQSNIFP